jgi:hypothetical protein
MFNSLVVWFSNKKSLMVFGTFVFLVTIILMPYVQNRMLAESSESDIKNRLVWAVKGECFFVKPINTTDNILVRVTDCDKVGK